MVNQGTLLGRVGKIETKTSSNGNKMSFISLVTSKKFVKDGEKQEKSTWHNVTLFTKLAEIAEKYVFVGDLLYVQGEMDNQKYTDTNGIERHRSFLLGHELKLMPKAKEHQPRPQSAPQPAQNAAFEDDIVPW